MDVPCLKRITVLNSRLVPYNT